MQIYRLMEKEHSGSLLRGSFRFGRLRYYQMREVVFEDESIGDAQEGVVSAAPVTAIFTDGEAIDTASTNLAKSGFIDYQGGTAMFFGTTFTKEIDCFVSSWSTSATPDLSGAGAAYDTCVIAAGAKSLAYYLSNLGVESKSRSRIQELFKPILARRVQYQDSTYNFSECPLPDADPFRKRTRYRYQSEYRLLLIPRTAISADFVTIDCPQAAHLLRSVPVQPSQVAELNAPAVPSDTSYYQKLLSSILEAWWQLQGQLNLDDRTRLATDSDLDAVAWRTSRDAWLIHRTAVLAEFDRTYLKKLRRCLYELRKAPLNEFLDRVLARGASSDGLISAYEHEASARTLPT